MRPKEGGGIVRIVRLFVGGPQFDDVSHCLPNGMDGCSDGTHFGTEGSACGREGEERVGHVRVECGQARMELLFVVIVLHHHRRSGGGGDGGGRGDTYLGLDACKSSKDTIEDGAEGL